MRQLSALCRRRPVQIALCLGLLAAVALATVNHHKAWMRERSEFATALNLKASDSVSAPGMLWLFGEAGYAKLPLVIIADPGTETMENAERMVQRVKRAFPESLVSTEYRRPRDFEFPPRFMRPAAQSQ